MKQVIRRSVFETNSSSQHSICVTKTDGIYDFTNYEDTHLYLHEDGSIYLWEGDLEFGRGFQVLSTFYDKLCFVIASLCSSSPNPESIIDELNGIIKKYMPDFNYIEVSPSRYYTYGYIDHQSTGLLQHFLKTHKLSIEDFLVHKKYIVIIDGDESCIWDTMRDAGLIDLSNIEEDTLHE